MNQKQFINNNGEPIPLEHNCATQSTFSQEIQRDYCEFPRNDPGFLNRRNSAGPIPFEAHNEVLLNDPLMVRHNTIGSYKFSPINEFSINVVNEHSQQHSEVNDQKQIHECDACNKRLCSLRSLKRHKNTCKRVRSQLDQGAGTEATMTTKEINMSNKSKSKNMNTGVITTSDNKKDFFQDSNSSFKIDQSNNTSSGSAINKTNIFISDSESINMEDDKVSDIVDSVVAKIRSQSNFNKTLITNHANVQSSYQSAPSQQKQPSIEHFEITNVMNATSSMNTQFVYNNGGTLKQSQPISEERHIYVESYESNSQRIPAHKFQLPPKSAPAVAPTQQFWPVMGTRLVQHIDGKSKNTASQITAHHNPDQINNNGDYSYSLSQYPTVAFDDSLYNKQVISDNIQTVQQQEFNPKQSDGERTPIVNTGTESSKQEVPPIKNVFRFLCPECNKPYSCRKNVKRHRVTQHKVSAQEAQDGFIKRITLPENQLQQIEQKKVNNKAEPSSPIKINAKNEIQKREEIKTFTCKNELQFHQNINQAEHQTTLHSNRQQQPNNPNAVYPIQHEARGGPPYSAPLPNQPQQPFFTYPGPYGNNNFNYPHINQSHNQDSQAQFYSQQQYQSCYPPSQPSMNIHSYNYHQQHHCNYQQSNNQQHAYSVNSGQLQPSNLLYGASHQIQQPLIRNSKIISTSTGCYANYHQQPQSLQYRQHQPTNEPYSQGQHSMEQGNQLVGTSNSVVNYTDTLEYWEQIKSMDLEPTTSDSDAIEMAKILEDLKRSDEEVAENGQPRQQAHQLNFSQQLNTTSMDTVNTRGIQRKAVELAEADTTFSPPQPDDSISRQSSNPSGIQRSNQQFSQFIPLGHQIPESPSYAIPSQTIFQFNHRTATNAKTEPIQQYISATNPQKVADDNNQKYVESSSSNIKQTNRKNNKDASGGTRKKKNIKGVQIEENIKRKKPEEFPYVDPDSTMNEIPVEDADQSSISFTGIYKTNSSIEQSSTMHDIHGVSVFKNIYHR